jgi:hypothetical protein
MKDKNVKHIILGEGPSERGRVNKESKGSWICVMYFVHMCEYGTWNWSKPFSERRGGRGEIMEGTNWSRVHCMHIWKCHNEISAQLLNTNKNVFLKTNMKPVSSASPMLLWQPLNRLFWRQWQRPEFAASLFPRLNRDTNRPCFWLAQMILSSSLASVVGLYHKYLHCISLSSAPKCHIGSWAVMRFSEIGKTSGLEESLSCGLRGYTGRENMCKEDKLVMWLSENVA